MAEHHVTKDPIRVTLRRLIEQSKLVDHNLYHTLHSLSSSLLFIIFRNLPKSSWSCDLFSYRFHHLLHFSVLSIFAIYSSHFTADDVLKEFRTIKEKRNDAKLIKILSVISRNQPKAAEYLQEAAKLLEK